MSHSVVIHRTGADGHVSDLRSCQRGGGEIKVLHHGGGGLCPCVVAVDRVLIDIDKLLAGLWTCDQIPKLPVLDCQALVVDSGLGLEELAVVADDLGLGPVGGGFESGVHCFDVTVAN